MKLTLTTKHAKAVVELDLMLLNAIIHNAIKYTPPDRFKWLEHTGMVDMHRAMNSAYEQEAEEVKRKANERLDSAIEDHIA